MLTVLSPTKEMFDNSPLLTVIASKASRENKKNTSWTMLLFLARSWRLVNLAMLAAKQKKAHTNGENLNLNDGWSKSFRLMWINPGHQCLHWFDSLFYCLDYLVSESLIHLRQQMQLFRASTMPRSNRPAELLVVSGSRAPWWQPHWDGGKRKRTTSTLTEAKCFSLTHQWMNDALIQTIKFNGVCYYGNQPGASD